MPEIITGNSQSQELTTQIDAATTDLFYVGIAKFGTADSDAKWQIRKMETTSKLTTVLYADGNRRYDNIWDNRASLTYSN